VHPPQQPLAQARSSSEAIHTSGTSSRRQSSASTRASIRSVFAANGASAFALRASATCTRQPAPRKVSATQTAPLIISSAADTSKPRRATSPVNPSRSAAITPSPSSSPALSSAHHAARLLAQSIPTYSTSASFALS